ncbi:flagellar assembly protein FliX [Falsiroseomonas oryziterrae]|uniref:flagellar assembly protein FliX n=1 Tax=Falsiroseomonas oryziterrae TaxID=2911368 RepID=UPI001F47B68B|nr:flagellar assembly protein FliX [Roseomonas sp. NPKOSM-4]
MTRVFGLGQGASPRRAARPAAGFTVAQPQAGGAAFRVARADPPVLLAVQDVPPAAAAVERQMGRAHAALDELRGLQLDLLRAQGDSARWERLAALVESNEAVADPALRSVLAELRLRARIELARRRRARPHDPDGSDG